MRAQKFHRLCNSSIIETSESALYGAREYACMGDVDAWVAAYNRALQLLEWDDNDVWTLQKHWVTYDEVWAFLFDNAGMVGGAQYFDTANQFIFGRSKVTWTASEGLSSYCKSNYG